MSCDRVSTLKVIDVVKNVHQAFIQAVINELIHITLIAAHNFRFDRQMTFFTRANGSP